MRMNNRWPSASDGTTRPRRRRAAILVVLLAVAGFQPGTAPAHASRDFAEKWDQFLERNPGQWHAGPESDGLVPWVAGVSHFSWPGVYPVDLALESGQEAADRSERSYLPPDQAVEPGGRDREPPFVDLSGFPGFSEEHRFAVTLAFRDDGSGVDPGSVRIEHNGSEVTTRFEVGPTAASSVSPLDLLPGKNLFTISVRDRAGNPTVAAAAVFLLSDDEIEQVAVSRSFLQEVAPLLGIDPEWPALALSRLDQGALPAGVSGEARRVTTLVYVPMVDGCPVTGAKVSTILYESPFSGRFEPGVALSAMDTVPEPGARVGPVLSPEEARRIMAVQTAEGVSALLSQPLLTWHRVREGEFRPAYSSTRYGLRREHLERDFAARDAFTTALITIDAQTGELVAAESLVHENEEFWLSADALRPVIVGNPANLDTGLKEETVRELRESLGGGFGSFLRADGPYARVLNNADAGVEVILWLVLGYFFPSGSPLSFNPLTEAFFTGKPAPDAFAVMGDGTADNTFRDDALDGWTAYYHTDRIARFLEHEVGFRHAFPDARPATQMVVGVNPLKLTNNAVAFPQLHASRTGPAGTLDRAGLVFGTGSGYAQTRHGGQTRFIRADFSRDRSVIYHEYGHTLLYAKGITGDSTNLASTLHEGFADYVSRVTRGGASEAFSDFILTGNGFPEEGRRWCAGVLPDEPTFVSLAADNPYGSVVKAHASGQAFCQALARAEDRLCRLYGRRENYLLSLAVTTASSWKMEKDASSVVNALLAADALAYVIEQLSGEHPAWRGHEIRTAFALHGLMESRDGRGAALSMTLGEGAAYRPGSDTRYVAATGVNTNYTLQFATDPAGSRVCHSENRAAYSVPGNRTTLWRGTGFSFEDLVRDCSIPAGSGPTDLYVRAISCTDVSDCQSALARNIRPLPSPAIPIQVEVP